MRRKKLKDFNNNKVRKIDVDELYDFLWDYMCEVRGANFLNMPPLSQVAYRILADGRWKRKTNKKKRK